MTMMDDGAEKGIFFFLQETIPLIKWNVPANGEENEVGY